MNFDEFDMVLIGIGEEFEDSDNSLVAYNNLCEKLGKKNYFIVSMCIDDKIYDSSLDKDRIVAPLGGKHKKQCPDACDGALYDINETKCPICGKELVFNNVWADNYIEDDYLPMWDKYKKWFAGTLNRKLLVLELGVSLRFPQIIRFPFERAAVINNKAKFIRVNNHIPQIDKELSDKGESIKECSVDWLANMD